MEERENLLRIFREARKAVENNDSFKLRQLSDQTNNTASRTQDSDNVAVAVVIYSISKIIERERYRTYSGWKKFSAHLNGFFDNSILYLETKEDEKFSAGLREIREEIEGIFGKMKPYIEEVFRKAGINKASKIYEHGLSMEKTAKLLGVSLWELASYSGQSQTEVQIASKEMDVKKRIKLAVEMFE